MSLTTLWEPHHLGAFPMAHPGTRYDAAMATEGAGPSLQSYLGDETQRLATRIFRQWKWRCGWHGGARMRLRLKARATPQWDVWAYCGACRDLEDRSRVRPVVVHG